MRTVQLFVRYLKVSVAIQKRRLHKKAHRINCWAMSACMAAEKLKADIFFLFIEICQGSTWTL